MLLPPFDPSGHVLLFGSERSGGCGSRDICAAFRINKRDDNGWLPPANLGCRLNFSGFDDGPTWVDDESGLLTIYFTSQNRLSICLGSSWIRGRSDRSTAFTFTRKIGALRMTQGDRSYIVRFDGKAYPHPLGGVSRWTQLDDRAWEFALTQNGTAIGHVIDRLSVEPPSPTPFPKGRQQRLGPSFA